MDGWVDGKHSRGHIPRTQAHCSDCFQSLTKPRGVWWAATVLWAPRKGPMPAVTAPLDSGSDFIRLWYGCCRSRFFSAAVRRFCRVLYVFADHCSLIRVLWSLARIALSVMVQHGFVFVGVRAAYSFQPLPTLPCSCPFPLRITLLALPQT